MNKLASSLFVAFLLLAPVASPAFATPRERDGGIITKVVRLVRSFLGIRVP
jgi:hypothetical protein